MLELNQLYNMDCMEGMKEFPDEYFDLAIVDPPYGIGIAKSEFWKSEKVPFKKTEYAKKDWDDKRPHKDYFDTLFKKSKNAIIWGGNYFIDLIMRPTSGWIVWDKENVMNFSCSDCEIAFSTFNKRARYFKYTWVGWNQGKLGCTNREKRIHPTQKPVALYSWLLQNYAKPGDKILDTHVGSASSLIACYDLGFDYVGFEIDKDYYAAAQARVLAKWQQTRLFDAVPEEPTAVAV